MVVLKHVTRPKRAPPPGRGGTARPLPACGPRPAGRRPHTSRRCAPPPASPRRAGRGPRRCPGRARGSRHAPAVPAAAREGGRGDTPELRTPARRLGGRAGSAGPSPATGRGSGGGDRGNVSRGCGAPGAQRCTESITPAAPVCMAWSPMFKAVLKIREHILRKILASERTVHRRPKRASRVPPSFLYRRRKPVSRMFGGSGRPLPGTPSCRCRVSPPPRAPRGTSRTWGRGGARKRPRTIFRDVRASAPGASSARTS